MDLNELLKDKQISKYRLSVISGVPQTTILDICANRTKIEKCSVKTLYKLAKALNVSMEDLIIDVMERRPSFEVFKK